jgi:hypothetical protein
MGNVSFIRNLIAVLPIDHYLSEKGFIITSSPTISNNMYVIIIYRHIFIHKVAAIGANKILIMLYFSSAE